MSEPVKLERGLGLVEATSLNMTFMVGIGPFVVIPFVIQEMHGGTQALVAWVAGAILAACDGCIWAELGAAMPQAGGSYVFCAKRMDRSAGDICLHFFTFGRRYFKGR
jgi:fructoselysine transporter